MTLPALAREPMGSARLGFLGVGWMGTKRLEAVTRLGVGEIVAVCDPARDRVARARALATGAVACGTIEEMVDHDLDGVVICTPSALHTRECLECLEWGLPIFCQKPLASTAAETTAVVLEAQTQDCLIDVDLCYRRLAAVEAIMDLAGVGRARRPLRRAARLPQRLHSRSGLVLRSQALERRMRHRSRHPSGRSRRARARLAGGGRRERVLRQRRTAGAADRGQDRGLRHRPTAAALGRGGRPRLLVEHRARTGRGDRGRLLRHQGRRPHAQRRRVLLRLHRRAHAGIAIARRGRAARRLERARPHRPGRGGWARATASTARPGTWCTWRG